MENNESGKTENPWKKWNCCLNREKQIWKSKELEQSQEPTMKNTAKVTQKSKPVTTKNLLYYDNNGAISLTKWFFFFQKTWIKHDSPWRPALKFYTLL